jgi:hypothetical protein
MYVLYLLEVEQIILYAKSRKNTILQLLYVFKKLQQSIESFYTS